MKRSRSVLVAVIIFGIMIVGSVLYLCFFVNRTYQPVPSPTQQTKNDDQQPRYTNPTYGFTVSYPPQAKLLTSAEEIRQSGYIPLCDPDASTACIVFSKDYYPGSNFDGAGVSVDIFPDLTTEKDCLTPLPMMHSDGSTIISGRTFKRAVGGDAAMSHAVARVEYDAFIDNVCYHLVASTATTTFEVYEPGTIRQFTSSQEQALTIVLENIIQSFVK